MDVQNGAGTVYRFTAMNDCFAVRAQPVDATLPILIDNGVKLVAFL